MQTPTRAHMPSHAPSVNRRRQGSALVAVLVLILAVAVSVAAVLRLAGHDVSLTSAHNEYKKALAVAEAGLERAFVELRKAILETGAPPQELLDEIPPPYLTGFAFAAPNQMPAFDILIEGDTIEAAPVNLGRWAGLNGDMRIYRLRVGATDARHHGVVLKQTVQVTEVPVCRFAALYQNDLEVFAKENELALDGPVHTNGDLFVGAEYDLYFKDFVRAAGRILRTCKHSAVYPEGGVAIEDRGGTAQGMMYDGGYLDHNHENWSVLAFQTWEGTVLDSAHGVPELRLLMPMSQEPRCIIERSEPDDHPMVAMQKFENKADVVVWRDSDGYTQAYGGPDGDAFPLTYEVPLPEDEPPPVDVPPDYVITKEAPNIIRFQSAMHPLGAGRLIQTDTFTIAVAGGSENVQVRTFAGGYETEKTLEGTASPELDELGFEAELVSIVETTFEAPPTEGGAAGGGEEGGAGGEEGGEAAPPAAYDIAGDVHLDYTTATGSKFEATKPDGTTITMNELKNNGPGYSYSGPATVVKINCQGDASTVQINGVDVVLPPGTRYTVTSAGMTVNVRNTKGTGNWNQSRNFWYVDVQGDDITINPVPAGMPPLDGGGGGGEAPPAGAGHTVGGEININPNNNPDREFTLTKPDGTQITRDDLHKDSPTGGDGTYYQGLATYIRVKPKGNGNQNTWIVDGEVFPLQNKNVYELTGDMTVRLYNDHPKNGKAMGHWWIETAGENVALNDEEGEPEPVPDPVTVDVYTLRVTSLIDTNPLEYVVFDFGTGAEIVSDVSSVPEGGLAGPDGGDDGKVAVSGEININPNNSPHSEFTLYKPDGSTITRDDLHQNSPTEGDGTYYQGLALSFRVKPKGNGNQNSFYVDGVAYELHNRNTYIIAGEDMNVRLYNAKVKNGKAMGHWWIDSAGGSCTVQIVGQDPAEDEPDDGIFIGCGVARSTEWTTRRFATVAPFGDWREGNGTAKTMHALDIDYEILSGHPSFAGVGKIVYAFSEFAPEDGTSVVRALNARLLPPGGMSLASRHPVYVRGNFNTEGDSQPALLCGDAVTLLSNAWQDTTSWAELADRPAETTLVNALIMTGDTETAGDYYSGGYENVLRLCENWSGKSLVFRGSIVSLWRSQTATGRFVEGEGRCLSPAPDMAYDQRFRDPAFTPPGCPSVAGFETLNWSQDSWRQDELASGDGEDGDGTNRPPPDGTN